MVINPAALSSDDKKQLQAELAKAGFYTGIVDGDWGPKSAAAFAAAQAARLVGPILPGTDLSDALRAEYARLWALATISPEHRAEVEAEARQLLAGRQRYEGVASSTGVPWYVIGLIHGREASFRFSTHLHNGDPLSARTVHVPAGRPATSQPPFSWAYSAADALTFDHFTAWHDWTLAGMLYKLEGYNGFGPRKHGRPTSYLWSMTAANVGGKYVADGVWDGTAIDREAGCVAVLKALVEAGQVSL